MPTLRSCPCPPPPTSSLSIPVNGTMSCLDAQGRKVWVHSCFLPFPYLLLVMYQRGWLSLPSKSVCCICPLCVIFLVMTHASPLFPSLSVLWCHVPSFSSLAHSSFFPDWARPDLSAWDALYSSYFNVSTSVMDPMTHLSKVRLWPVVVSLCLRNLFFFFFFPSFVLP